MSDVQEGLERDIIESLDLVTTPWVDLAAAAAGVPCNFAGSTNALITSTGMRQLAPAPVNELTNVRGVRSAPVRSEPPAPAPVPVPLREQDRLLPMANIAWLMAAELTKDAKISRDAKVMMQEFVSEFICFVTSEANDCSLAANRKAISQEDILNALENLGAARSRPPSLLCNRDPRTPIRAQIWRHSCLQWKPPAS